MKVQNQFDNKLLKRREVVASFTSDGPTVTRAFARKEIAKQLKSDEKLIIVSKIKTTFGSRDVEVQANVYEKRDQLELLTPKHLLERNKIEESAEEKKDEASE